MSLFVYDDVPQELLDCLNVIDFSRIPADDLAAKLQLLREYGRKYLPARTNFTRSNTPSRKKIRMHVPQVALDVINEFDFRDVPYLQRVGLKPIFMKWVKNNLPTY